ncbi:MAG TPA: tRNA (N(6)-L-threonylcarbamoyladenosine(37)-C(2))-methylthiotransferase MtaB [Acidobacteriota bacterium]|nr:tRNA (N(6)-L-threonylcarbamoyladenosine(37)-C(2))-methylthiotransferase MtaB [Acidobacteriota bacterium]
MVSRDPAVGLPDELAVEGAKKATIEHGLFVILLRVKKSTFKKLSIRTVGCRLNQYETERMVADLYRYGFRRAKKGEPADLYIINTCTVTHRADQSSRNMISRAVRENPDASVVVAGCYVDSDPDRIAAMEGVDVLLPNADKERIGEILPERLPELFAEQPETSCAATYPPFSNYNRSWLKISDGCNQNCSFCVLPAVRGRLRNRPPLEILDEVNALVENGFNEVVLTGVHVGHYRYRRGEPRVKNLAGLCRLILEGSELKKLRISSIEPQMVSDELVDTYTQMSGRICRHLHVPLQSGSPRILRLMRRPYTQNFYVRRLALVKETVPEMIVGADVIVGFPGETNEDFERTRRICESGLIDYLHVFSYSDRPGTPAAELPHKVKPDVIKRRNAILTRISGDFRARSHQRQVGLVLDVIAERRQKDKGFFWGISDNYVRVKMPPEFTGGRQIVRVRVRSAREDYVEGELVDVEHPLPASP